MRWGRVEVGEDFLFVIALALYLDDQGVVPLALLVCGFHELGHLMALYALGGRLSALRLSWVGAEMAVEGRLGYWGELVLALAGPAINIIIAFLFGYFEISPLFCGLNLALGVLNLLPAQRLDGGRAVYALCCHVRGPGLALTVMRGTEGVLALLLLTAGSVTLALGGSFTLLFLAIWVLWTGKS